MMVITLPTTFGGWIALGLEAVAVVAIIPLIIMIFWWIIVGIFLLISWPFRKLSEKQKSIK